MYDFSIVSLGLVSLSEAASDRISFDLQRSEISIGCLRREKAAVAQSSHELIGPYCISFCIYISAKEIRNDSAVQQVWAYKTDTKPKHPSFVYTYPLPSPALLSR